jgi:hypothetical protein
MLTDIGTCSRPCVQPVANTPRTIRAQTSAARQRHIDCRHAHTTREDCMT